MRLILFLLFIGFTGIMACKTAQKTSDVHIVQGITGTVTEMIGNQMPRIGQTPASPKAYPTTVFFYEPTNISQVSALQFGAPLYKTINTKLIGFAQTDSAGSFHKSLPVGDYSVFVQVGQNFFANSFDIRNNISVISVEKKKLTDLKIVVNIGATY